MQDADSYHAAGDPALTKTPSLVNRWHGAWRRVRHAAVAAVFLLAGALTAHAQPYAVTNLGVNGQVPANGINDLGQVAGYAHFSGQTHAFFYDGATVIDLGILPPGTDINGNPPYYSESVVQGLNNAGQVAGYSVSYFNAAPSTRIHAFSWTQGGGMVDLGTLGGSLSYAFAINDAGQVVGYSSTAGNSAAHAFLWTQADGMVDLGGTLGGSYSYAISINDAGQVAGNSYNTGNSSYRAFSWTSGGGLVDLGTLGGSSSYALSINDAGQVVGYSLTAGNSAWHAFSWTQAGGMIDLGTLAFGNDIDGNPPNYGQSVALSINNAGQVIGNSANTYNNNPWIIQHPFSWTQSGGMVDLGSLNAPPNANYSYVGAINDAGQVVGGSYTPSYMNHAFLYENNSLYDLNNLLSNPPPGLELYDAFAISNNGTIAAQANVGLVLLTASAHAPSLGPIALDNDPVAVNTVVTASAGFTDADAADIHTASFTFGDASPAAAGAVTESGGAGTASGAHSFTAAGIYPITLTVTDNSGLSSQVSRNIVVYDPSAGFVTGGGWFISPPGAYLEEPTLGGRATFGFVSKYLKGAKVPTGKTEFQFQAANLNFHSDTYDWLVVSGARAQYKGVGTINGLGNYKFLLTAVDGALLGTGGKDRFRIKIWHYDADAQQDVVDYDNQLDTSLIGTNTEGTLLGGGSIVIHKK